MGQLCDWISKCVTFSFGLKKKIVFLDCLHSDRMRHLYQSISILRNGKRVKVK